MAAALLAVVAAALCAAVLGSRPSCRSPVCQAMPAAQFFRSSLLAVAAAAAHNRPALFPRRWNAPTTRGLDTDEMNPVALSPPVVQCQPAGWHDRDLCSFDVCLQFCVAIDGSSV